MKNDRFDRRDFLKTATAGFALLLTEEELRAAGAIQDDPIPGPPLKIGVIGAGLWGRDILTTLSRQPAAQVTAISDIYEPYLKKGLEVAPKASGQADYRRLIESPEVEAVVVATPTHQHKEIVLAALQAGKHVYCEAPLANTVEDARAIAQAALQVPKQVFQAGLQGRSNPLYRHVLQFVKTGVLGNAAYVTAQWNKKQSWRRVAPTPEREKEMNWRLSHKTAAGLIGEIGLHQLDLINWYLGGLPAAVQGFGSITNWNDGREAPDTIQTIFEYPAGVRAVYTSTLTSSFSDSFTTFQGSNSSLIMREKRSWMVKEADSALLGWEVYARKETVHNETGIAMVADATKLIEEGKEPGKEGPVEPAKDSLNMAFEYFIRSIRAGDKPVCDPKVGYQATVIGIKANEAILSGARVVLDSALFELKQS
ncbi:MAG: Gfo/Idh/MocA family oxidoreductase [Acidobacteria bacterium]|nr:Gfo/Idh/MocA family oxidoreductase [Acidobacteriota bacterium]